jgi:AAA+ superfamily predicted ATPase
MDDFDELEKRKFVRCCRSVEHNSRDSRRLPTYRVPVGVINAVRKGEGYKAEEHRNLSIDVFFDMVDDLFDQRTEGELTYDGLVNDSRDLVNDNMHLLFSQKIRAWNFSSSQVVLLLRFCNLFVTNDDDCIGIHDLENIFDGRSELRRIERDLKEGKHRFMEMELIENANNDGFGDTEYYKLTDKAKENLLSEVSTKVKSGNRGKDCIKADKITIKSLFYNEKESRQVAELMSLLREENFASVQKRLSGGGMRGGFACLFYGPPGTGKTETVYQIARQTSRDIMTVDMSQIKDKWVGESEKNIKRVFERYRGTIKAGELAPILLFNEADAIINKRTAISGSNAAVEKMNNTMQNIILQEIETLEGILIATTNLTQNMDKAFERRFLYKIEFSKPGTEARASIWRSIIPGMSENDARELASCYNFSGGQIENVARKRTVDSILSGADPALDKMKAYCREETLERDAGNRIGFGV